MSVPTNRRRHMHKRSSAISGDFDVSFFAPPQPGSSSSLSRSVPTSTTSSPIRADYEIPIVNVVSDSSCSSITTPVSPASRFFMTEEAQIDRFTNIPDAVIDLDEVLSSKKPLHKRTESAPELENFFGRVLSSPQRADNPIVEDIEEEDEEDELGLFKSESSSMLSTKHDNSSTQSVNSNGSVPPRLGGTLNTPSVQSLRGKVRYQAYYSQLSSSTPSNKRSSMESTASNNKENVFLRPSVRSKNTTLMPPPSIGGSRSPVRNSLRLGSGLKSSAFQFESVSYDIPKGFHREHGYSQSVGSLGKVTTTPTPPPLTEQSHSRSNSRLSRFSHSRSNSRVSSRSVSPVKTHRKSASLLSSITNKFHRRNSSSYKKSHMSNELLLSPETTSMDTTLRNDDTTLIQDDDDENILYGEPGPMVSKYSQEHLQIPNEHNQHQQHRHRLFGWMKKKREELN